MAIERGGEQMFVEWNKEVYGLGRGGARVDLVSAT